MFWGVHWRWQQCWYFSYCSGKVLKVTKKMKEFTVVIDSWLSTLLCPLSVWMCEVQNCKNVKILGTFIDEEFKIKETLTNSIKWSASLKIKITFTFFQFNPLSLFFIFLLCQWQAYMHILEPGGWIAEQTIPRFTFTFFQFNVFHFLSFPVMVVTIILEPGGWIAEQTIPCFTFY